MVDSLTLSCDGSKAQALEYNFWGSASCWKREAGTNFQLKAENLIKEVGFAEKVLWIRLGARQTHLL